MYLQTDEKVSPFLLLPPPPFFTFCPRVEKGLPRCGSLMVCLRNILRIGLGSNPLHPAVPVTWLCCYLNINPPEFAGLDKSP